MAQVQGEEIYLAHSGQEVDDNIDEVQAARGSEASLSARLADIVGDFEADQQRQNTEISTKITLADILGLGKVLASGDSMDNLPLGRFTCTNGTIAANVSNAPWDNSGFFGLTMESVRAGDRFVQLAIKNNDDFEIAKRRYAGTWSAWVYGITTPASASTQSAPASLMQAGRIGAELTDAGNDEEEEER